MKQIIKERQERGLNQTEFWGRVGVSQACGSRYEAGRPLPEPVQLLVELVYLLPQTKSIDRLKELRK